METEHALIWNFSVLIVSVNALSGQLCNRNHQE
jgi:hypothetical protein